MSDADVYAQILGKNWRTVLETRNWDFDRPRRESGVERRGWTRNSPVTGTELAVAAAEAALRDADIPAAAIDCILVATCTPPRISSSMAAKVACRLATDAAAIDVRAGGAGGLNALATAALYHSAGCKNSLVIAVDTPSWFTGEHIGNALLFGDGAAALVLTSSPEAGAAGFAGAVMGNNDWQGVPFTILGALPPSADFAAEDYAFTKPDRVYRDCLASSWNTAIAALIDAYPEASASPAAVLPYAVTADQTRKCSLQLNGSAATSIELLSAHGCIGCASPLAGIAQHLTNQRAGRLPQPASTGELIASVAVGGGISWTGMVWRT